MNQYAKIGAIAGAMVLVGVLLTIGLRKASDAPLTVAAAPTEASMATPSSDIAAQSPIVAATSASADVTAAPWETGPRTASAASASASVVGNHALPTPPPTPTSSSAQLRAAIEQMDRQMTQNETQAQALLRQLDTAQATGKLPPGMNAEAARNNIRIAIRAQQLGRELVNVSQQPDTPGRQQRMTEISSELIALREGLRYDVNQPVAAKTTP